MSENKTCLVTGCGGQDGSYLAEHLLNLGYEVHGMLRRNSTPEHQSTRLELIEHKLHLYYGDVTDPLSCNSIMAEVMPDEVYNLAGQSHVRISSDVPHFTAQTNAIGVLNMLEAVRTIAPHARYYQASVDENEPVLIRHKGTIRRVAMKDTIGMSGFEVLTHDTHNGDCCFLPVKRVMEHGYRDTFKIKACGQTDIRVTGDHSVFVWNEEGAVECRKAEEISAGDKIVTYCGQLLENHDDPVFVLEYTKKKHVPSRWTGTHRYDVHSYRKEITITPDLARVCGYYLAEGCSQLAHRQNRVAFTFGNHEFGMPCIQDTIDVIQRVFGTTCKTYERNSSTIVRAQKKDIATFFSQFGCNAHTKRLPSFVWELPRESVIEFLHGYANDAKIEDNGACVFSTASPELQIDIAYLCRINGIPARRFKRLCKGRILPQGTYMKDSISHDVHVPSGYLYGEIRQGSRTPSAVCMPSSAVVASPIAKANIPSTIVSQIGYKKCVSRRYIQKYMNPNRLADIGLGVAEVSSVEKSVAVRVMDFEVPGTERFFCGALPVLAHNSSSEMYGNQVDDDGFQRITTRMRPVSPYGCAKLYGFNITRHYREAYGLHCSNGVLFNHESPRRASNFVTAKIIKAAVRILRGAENHVVLGNLDSQRDWGDSRDYVRAMHMMLQADEPGDWVVATGQTRSVRDLCKYVFEWLELGDYQQYVLQDKRYMRPNELHLLRGDSTPMREQFGWKPDWTFEQTISSIIMHYEQWR